MRSAEAFALKSRLLLDREDYLAENKAVLPSFSGLYISFQDSEEAESPHPT